MLAQLSNMSSLELKNLMVNILGIMAERRKHDHQEYKSEEVDLPHKQPFATNKSAVTEFHIYDINWSS